MTLKKRYTSTKAARGLTAWIPNYTREKGAHGRIDINISMLAEDVGIHPSHCGRILTGAAAPSIKVAGKLAEALNLSLDALTEIIQYRRILNLHP